MITIEVGYENTFLEHVLTEFLTLALVFMMPQNSLKVGSALLETPRSESAVPSKTGVNPFYN